jgi:hypothetical protein
MLWSMTKSPAATHISNSVAASAASASISAEVKS